MCKEKSDTQPNSECGLLLVDTTSLLFRAYYGMGSRKAQNGREVGAVVGVAFLLLTLLQRHNSRYVVLSFDAGRETFRNQLDERYKANRGEAPDDLKPQFELVQQLACALGFTVSSVSGYEADDVMATWARLARKAALPVRLLSSDKDLCQLVTDDEPTLTLEDPKTAVVWNEEGVQHRLGVPPKYVVDYLSLVGDSSDNVLGVRGVGPKAAQSLIRAFGGLDEIYANLNRVEFLSVRGSKSLANKLQAGREEAYLARRLVQLHCFVPVLEKFSSDKEGWDVKAESYWKGPCSRQAEDLFAQLGILSSLESILRVHRQMK